MKKALLQYSRETFSAMQSTHEQSQNQQTSLAAPISPTPNDAITLFLPHLNLGPDSLLIDLGCGDGRWLVTASKLTKCKCLGIDVDEQRIRLATQSIDKEGLTAQIQVRNQDVFEFLERDCLHFPIADVLIIYLFRDAMKRIGPSLKLRASDMKSGMKILCVGFGLPDWKASRTEKIHGIALYLYEHL
jgi:SAM-dependent methyltransferase